MNTEHSALQQARYVSLATFRKNGVKVATPVWCAASGNDLYVFSESKAGKIKRLRNSPRVELAPCDYKGKLLGPWSQASGQVVADPTEVNQALAALRAKYGWQMRLADAGARLTGRFDARAYIRLQLRSVEG